VPREPSCRVPLAWYVPAALSGWRPRSTWVIAVTAAAALTSGCGSGSRQDASEPIGNFPVRVTAATFPASQRLAEHTNMVISVTNSGQKTIPNIAVTILDSKNGTAAQAFGSDIGTTSSDLASRSRAVWIVDRAPEKGGVCGYSCQQGGPGGAVTTYSNTWALGPLAPGKTVTFNWAVTPVQSGTHTIRYEIAAGLNGKAKAVDGSGKQPTGAFHVIVHQAPQRSYVNDNGQVITRK
jgi:hypothetical protein